MPTPIETPRRNLTRAAVPALAAAVAAGALALYLTGQIQERNAQPNVPQSCILNGIDQIGGPISLVDANNRAVTQVDFARQPAILYFGYTHCPDVCPTTMYTLAQALSQPGGYDIQSVLITVDPERDTPAVLGQYVRTNGFPPGLQGLSGTRAQVEAAERAFQVYAHKNPPAQGAPADA